MNKLSRMMLAAMVLGGVYVPPVVKDFEGGEMKRKSPEDLARREKAEEKSPEDLARMKRAEEKRRRKRNK